MSRVSGQEPLESKSAPQAALEAEPLRNKRHTVGALLRETREKYAGDVERIASALRIRAQYLVAIEEDRYERLPAPVYALGFVRAYAVHLGLDGEEAVRCFKQEANGLEISRDLVFPVPLSERSIPGGPILAAAVLLLLAAYGAWYYLSSGGRVRPERVSPVPAILLHPPQKAPAPLINGRPATAAPPAPKSSVTTTPLEIKEPPQSPPTSSATSETSLPAGTSQPSVPSKGKAPVFSRPSAPIVTPRTPISSSPSPRAAADAATQTAALPSGVGIMPGHDNSYVYKVTDGPVHRDPRQG